MGTTENTRLAKFSSTKTSRSLLALIGMLGFAAIQFAPAANSQSTDLTAVPSASCGPGSRPETGVQGQVPQADRKSGRSKQGYQCNLKRIGWYQGSGAGILSARYGKCVFMGSFGTGIIGGKPGVQVVDVSDPNNPKLVRILASPSMVAGTWETLKVNQKRGLLAAAGTTVLTGAMLFSVYDVKTDCTNPKLLNGMNGTSFTTPIAVLSHEGNFAPDGNTYYSTSSVGGWISAIDLTNPSKPKAIFNGSTGLGNHGLSLSPDGNTMYGVTVAPAGVQILDVSSIQARANYPAVKQISALSWPDGLLTQHTIPITVNDHKYLIAVDEGGSGSVRILDIQNPKKPSIVSRLKLAINLPENTELRAQDTGGDGLFGYEAHYCSVNRSINPTGLACGFVQSGIRVFDIANPARPREIAYYNPPAVSGGIGKLLTLSNSPHALGIIAPPLIDPWAIRLNNLIGSLQPQLNTDWCMSPPWFVGKNQLWATCSDNGMMALRFTNGIAPNQ